MQSTFLFPFHPFFNNIIIFFKKNLTKATYYEMYEWYAMQILQKKKKKKKKNKKKKKKKKNKKREKNVFCIIFLGFEIKVGYIIFT